MTLSLIERARKLGNPLIENGKAIFVWQADAKNKPQTTAAPWLRGDFSDWERGHPLEMQPAGKGVWTVEIALPADAYIEYAFFDGEERFPDPLNSRLTPNGMGKYNHSFYMPEAQPTTLTQPQPGVRKGKVTRHKLPTLGFSRGEERLLYLYQPPTDQPVPLLLVWDGADYLRRAHLATMVDNLISARRIRPLALAMIQNGGPARFMEYACSESTIMLLLTSLLPYVSQHLNLLDPAQDPGSYGVLGASMGGLMSLYTACRLPQLFGGAICQSGAFSIGDGEGRIFDMVLYDLIERSEKLPLKIWMDVGRYDFEVLKKANPRMAALLRSRGYELTYREYNAGHNYPAWRDEIWRGLEDLFGV